MYSLKAQSDELSALRDIFAHLLQLISRLAISFAVLFNRVPPSWNFETISCRGVFYTGIRLFGCRKCDFDLCETCLLASGRDCSQVVGCDDCFAYIRVIRWCSVFFLLLFEAP